MLFILAHDRRKEIAISRAMGASKGSVMTIFTLAGLLIGLLGTGLGLLLSMITLHYLPEILFLIGRVQGHELLQQSLYGEIGSQTVRCATALFTVCSVSLAASCAGFLAALRACRINVSEALRG